MAKIKIKNSLTSGLAPAGLSLGEVAINIPDKKIYVGNVVENAVVLIDGNNLVVSINGSTGAITNVARTNEGNTFSVQQVFNAGITASSTSNVLDIIATTDGCGLRIAQAASGSNARVGGIRLGKSTSNGTNSYIENYVGILKFFNGISGTNSTPGLNMFQLSTTDAQFGVPIAGATFSSLTGEVKIQKSGYVGSDSAYLRIVGADSGSSQYNSDIRANASASANTIHTLPAVTGTLLNTASTINATTSTITSSNVNATRYLAFVGGTGNTGIFIDDVTTPLTYNPQGGNIGAKKVTLTTSSNVLTLDSAAPNVTLTDGSNISIFGVDSFAANYSSGRFTISNDGDGLDINASTGITLNPGSGVVEVASAVVSDGGYRITSNAINSRTGTTYSLLSTDNGKVITWNTTSGSTLTIPSGLPVGFNTTLISIGTGSIGITGSGVTLNSFEGKLNMAGQHAAVSIISYSTNVFNIAGGLTG